MTAGINRYRISTARSGLAACFDSLFALYIIIKLLRINRNSGQNVILKHLKTVMVVIVGTIIFANCGASFSRLLLDINTADQGTCYLISSFIMDRIAPAFVIWILVRGILLSDHLRTDPYGEKAIQSIRVMARVSAVSLVAIMSSILLKNVLHLILIRQITQVSFQIVVPVFDLSVVLASYFLAAYFAQSREMKCENDQFI
jgi:hypothetical protein